MLLLLFVPRKDFQREEEGVLFQTMKSNKPNFRETPNLTIICIGPLTNLARALQKDPEFAHGPAKLVIMGGNYLGKFTTETNGSIDVDTEIFQKSTTD